MCLMVLEGLGGRADDLESWDMFGTVETLSLVFITSVWLVWQMTWLGGGLPRRSR